MTVGEGLGLVEPAAAALAPSSWGAGKDLSTWDSPAVAELAFAARRAELRTVARASGHAQPRAALERAARELLAIQSSDWAFMATGDLASDYPHQRLKAHSAALEAALAALTDSAPAPDPNLRHLAPDLDLGLTGNLLTVRALILSWEYPPLIEGGLARHVRKLAEGLAAQGIDIHVIARGREEDPVEEESGGVLIHRVREPQRPRDLGEFVAWIEHMNSDMLAVGVELGDRFDFDVVHGHDWLVASAGDHLAKRFRAPFVGPSTRPSTDATRAGSTSTRSPTSTASRRGWPTAPSG